MMRAPHFWSAGLDPKSREAAPMLRLLLTPPAALYSTLTARRIKRTQPLKLSIPVICIGNLTSGGSGKTPVAQAIRAHLLRQNINAVTLSRGYGGSLSGPLRVEPDTHTARTVGDEPLMLSAYGESWISRDRRAGGKAIEAKGTGTIIMDDGHQNPHLFKDLSLIVIDSEAPFGNGFVIPKGPLREPITAGLNRADAIILMGTGPIPDAVKQTRLPVLRAQLVFATPLPTGPVFAFAGIGRPARFFNALRAAGMDLRDTMEFADHHPYSAKDIEQLQAIADKHAYQLVTTRKDHVRLPEAVRAAIVPIDVKAEFDDWASLDSLCHPLFTEDDQ